MNIIVGASGQVGMAIAEHLIKKNIPVKAVIRNAEKAVELESKGVAVVIADAFDLPALKSAFKNGKTVFLLTPETGQSDDVIGDTKKILENYKSAIASSGITKLVGLSSMGAQYGSDSGNLEMSYLLEHAFTGMDLQQIFIRPAYYFSNWMLYLPAVKQNGILSTFYPENLEIPMISPIDVARFVAVVMVDDVEGSPIYEVEGPEWYSSNDVANIFGEVLGRKSEARQIPKERWKETLEQIGFSEDAVKNFIKMTDIVVEGKAKPEGVGTIAIKTKTTLKQYLKSSL